MMVRQMNALQRSAALVALAPAPAVLRKCTAAGSTGDDTESKNDSGIRTIYGMTGAESIPVLKAAIAQLGDDVDDDYWKPTEGNAKRALTQLLALATMRPEGIWHGD